jgi:hypothetical protein
VTPQTAALPAAPTGVAAQGASSSAWVTWTPPAADPDRPITGYTVTPYVGAVAQPQVRPGPSATAATIAGLTNGTAYTFRVSATSQAGTGPDSAASGPVTPSATIFDFGTPGVVDSADTGSIELGVKFRPDFDGSVTGVRFYKGPGNTGVHLGSLWTAGGQRLAQATFGNETAAGWQSVQFATPVPVSAGTTYVASYFAPSGHYSYTGAGLASAIDNPPLHTLAGATSPNGVYGYSPTTTFPRSAYNDANYWVDVMYSLGPPGAVSGVAAVPTGRTSATVSWSAPSGGGPPSSYRITPYAGSDPKSATTVAGSATSAAVTGLTAGTEYTFTVRAANEGGAGPESDRSNAITPGSATPPAPPTDVVAQPASRSALVSWSAPAADGGSPVTTQTVTPYVGSAAQTPVQVGGTATSTTVSGLTNGTSYTFKVTATNTAGTSGPSDGSNAVAPAATIFDFAKPAVIDSLDSGAVELGLKFRSGVAAAVTGLRFYKAAANTGPHVGSLWTADGQRLAQATFTGESASGWQSVTFDAPVAIAPNTTYVASYFAPHGHYTYTGAAFASASVDNAPLSALASTTSPNGVYLYSGSSAFPTQTFNSANYWVDVLVN